MISLGAKEVQWAYIRLDGKNLRQALDVIEKEFKAVAPGHPFLFSFLDEDVARQYEKEARWSLMISIVSLFAVLIACSGVFALAFQSSVRKTKEIGIRKVLGASIPQIIGLLGREFVWMAAAGRLPGRAQNPGGISLQNRPGPVDVRGRRRNCGRLDPGYGQPPSRPGGQDEYRRQPPSRMTIAASLGRMRQKGAG
jgi:hypothetical protein